MESTNTPAIKATANLQFRFTKKPVTIEAALYEGAGNFRDHMVPDWIWTALESGAAFNRAGDLVIKTLEGDMVAAPGDWVIRGLKGELYPCKPDIFALSYEPAATPAIQAVAPILTWQERAAPDRQYWGAGDERPYMRDEIAELRAALAAVPAQQPTDSQSGSIRPSAEPADRLNAERAAFCKSFATDSTNCDRFEGWLARAALSPAEQSQLAGAAKGGDTCPHCGIGDIELSRTCHNSACTSYATPETVYEGWKVAAPAAPVAPDLARLRVWTCAQLQGAAALASVKFVELADVERLLSHSAQAPVEPLPFCPACEGSGESTQMSDSGPDAYEIQVPCPHCNGDGGLAAAYQVTLSLLDAEQKANNGIVGKAVLCPDRAAGARGQARCGAVSQDP